MNSRPFNTQERAALLQARRDALAKYHSAMDQSGECPPWSEAETRALTAAGGHLNRAVKAEREYFECLPRQTMSCCPFDGKPLVRTFDPYSFDGLWWRCDASPDELPSCPHFCVLAGAVNYDGHAPRASDSEVYPGPQIPYVIPRLLNNPRMIAVVSRLDMENGYVAYPVAYFAERRPPPQELTPGWARTNLVYTKQLGAHGWRIPNDVWDFDLLPWLEKGKVRWCEPDSGNQKLSDERPEQCPYIDLPGERQRIVVRGDELWTAGLPDGQPIWPA